MITGRWFAPGMTVLGAILGSVVWYVCYSASYAPAIEFDGPAALTLGLALIAGSVLIGGIGFGLYNHKNKDRSVVPVLRACLAAGLISCAVLGYALSKYEMQHTSHCVERDSSGTCLD